MSITSLSFISFPGNTGNSDNTLWQCLPSTITSLSSASNTEADLHEGFEVQAITWLKKK